MATAPSSPKLESNAEDFRGVLAAGSLCGLLGGLVMLLLILAYVTTLGMPFIRPLEWMAAALYGAQALYRGDTGVVWSGFVLHALTSLIWGAFFSLFVNRHDARSKAISLGLLFGVAVWVIMSFFILPFIDPVMSVQVSEVPFAWFLLHLVFGAALAFTPALSRRFNGQFKGFWHLPRAFSSHH